MQNRDDRFQAIYDTHSRLVFNFLYRFLGDAEDAGDAVTETFRRAHRGLADYRGDGSERAWLMAIAANVAKRVKAHKKRHAHLSLDELAEGERNFQAVSPSDPEGLVLDSVEAERMLAALEPLPRAAVWMRVGLRMTDEEVAEALGVPVGTVKSWVWRSLARMRKQCAKED